MLDSLVGLAQEKASVLRRALFGSGDFLRRFLVVVYGTCFYRLLQILGQLRELLHVRQTRRSRPTDQAPQLFLF